MSSVCDGEAEHKWSASFGSVTFPCDPSTPTVSNTFAVHATIDHGVSPQSGGPNKGTNDRAMRANVAYRAC
jgi:hypothetical protein